MDQSSADRSRGGEASTLHRRDDKGGDGRFLSSEQGASRRPADTSSQWKAHAVEDIENAVPGSCSNCGEYRELRWFFARDGKRRVEVPDHTVGKNRCNKNSKRPRGKFMPNDDAVKTITREGLRKAVQTEARNVANKTTEVK